MGGHVWASRLVNQKLLLLVMVGINIILSVWNEYVKLAWEFTGKPWRENRDFLHQKKFEMTQKQENCVHIEVLCILESQFWKVWVAVSGFLTFENIWHHWNYKNANNFLGFKTPKKYAYQIPQNFRSPWWKKTWFHFKSRQAICTLLWNDCVNQR